MTNVEALTNLYTALGGRASDLADVYTNAGVLRKIYALNTGGSESDVAGKTTAEIIDAIAYGQTNVGVSALAADTDLWGTAVSAIQTGVTVTGNAITGTLTKLTSGQLVTDWGAGYFLALDFDVTGIAEDTVVSVGLDPSEGSGLQELDVDHAGVFKITDKAEQRLLVVSRNGANVHTQTFDLSGLTLSEGAKGTKGVKSK